MPTKRSEPWTSPLPPSPTSAGRWPHTRTTSRRRAGPQAPLREGQAPLGPGRRADDEALNLHHVLQTQEGPIAEVTAAFHSSNSRVLHWKSGTKIPTGIDRNEFRKWSQQYWKNRAKDFG
ncbi:HNH/ENDO VII family nuclease [Streptomyces sp. IB201691-2A2]|uniref:HNH/ENDO VII family nuclease n=1 Tax=Streptomyces sp. IB201691-2A2 TaxID=2561920 RepID=UPI0037DA2590